MYTLKTTVCFLCAVSQTVRRNLFNYYMQLFHQIHHTTWWGSKACNGCNKTTYFLKLFFLWIGVNSFDIYQCHFSTSCLIWSLFFWPVVGSNINWSMLVKFVWPWTKTPSVCSVCPAIFVSLKVEGEETVVLWLPTSAFSPQDIRTAL